MNPETENKIAEGPSQKKELNQVGVGGIKSLRTLEGDIAEALKNLNVTQISIAENARNDAKANPAQPQFQNTPIPPAPKKEEPRDLQSEIIRQIKTEPEIAIAPQVRQADQQLQQQVHQTQQQVQQPQQQAPVSKQAMLVRPVKAPQVIRNKIAVKNTAKNSVLFLFAMIFIGASFYGLYFFYNQSPLPYLENNEPVQQANTYKSLILSDSREDLFFTTLTGINIKEILRDKKALPITKEGSIVEILIGKGLEDDKTVITGEEFISITTENTPESVERSVKNRFMYGFYEKEGVRLPFIVFTTDLFQNLFSGILKWEPVMRADFSNWFMNDVPVNTTFVDKIYKNRDLRILNDINGDIVLLYTFLDKDTLVITTRLSTLDEIIVRYEKQIYTR